MKVEEGMAWNAAVVSAHDNKNVRKDLSSETRKRPRESATTGAYDDLDEDVIGGGELTTLGEEKKRRLTVEQVNFLEMSFNIDPKLEPERKVLIGKQLGIRPRQVAIWFQNRRARWKNKQLEQDYESLKLKYDAVFKENQSLLKSNEEMAVENKQLQDQVSRLTALLQCSGKDGISAMLLARTPTDSNFGFKEPQSSGGGKSELTSPTSKLSDDHSEIQDSGRSYLTTQEAAAAASIITSEASFGEFTSISTPCSALKVEVEYPPFLMPEELFGNVLNHPLLFQQLAANNVCLEDACSFLFSWEDQTPHGFS